MDTKRNTGKETKKMVKNEMDLRFDARSENEAFARVAVAGFVSVLNPTLEELSDMDMRFMEWRRKSFWQKRLQRDLPLCRRFSCMAG